MYINCNSDKISSIYSVNFGNFFKSQDPSLELNQSGVSFQRPDEQGRRWPSAGPPLARRWAAVGRALGRRWPGPQRVTAVRQISQTPLYVKPAAVC